MDGVELLQRQIAEALEREGAVEQAWKNTSKAVDLGMFTDVEDFPVNGVGEVQWGTPEEATRMYEAVRQFLQFDKAFANGRAGRVWPGYLEVAFPWMTGWSCEDMVVALLMRAQFHRTHGRSQLQYFEGFAGCGNLSKAAIRAGLRGVSLDKDINVEHDILSQRGLRLWLCVVTSLQPGALLWLGVPCSSFVILSRSGSLRHESNHMLGDEARDFVLEGNCLADLACLVMLLAWLLGCKEGLEQSFSSVLPACGCMRGLMPFIGAKKTITYHWCFGAPTLKPLQLWSSHPFMELLRRERPAASSESALARADGEGRFTGCKDLLVESQMYTPQFGKAIVEACLYHRSV